MTSKKILFTGAGFSSNFGLPLASGVWGLIFNDANIQECQDIRMNMLSTNGNPYNTFNYEYIYNEVIGGMYCSEASKRIFLKRIDHIFSNIFEDVTISSINSSPINLVDLKKFIKLFSKCNSEGCGVFTLNYDLFLERLFLDELTIPFIGNCLVNTHYKGLKDLASKKKISDLITSSNFKNEIRLFPENVDDLNEEYFNIINETMYPVYIKLHGSIGWSYSGASQIHKFPFVIGFQKEDRIDDEPLLKKYFDIFKEKISSSKVDLLFIGYSFSDNHVNKILVESIKKPNSSIRIHIVDPSPIEVFLEKMTNNICLSLFGADKGAWKDSSDTIKNSIYGYYQGTLKEIFPKDKLKPNKNIVSNTILWNQIRENFFNV